MRTEYEIITGQNIKRLSNGAVINRYSHIVSGADIGDGVMIGEFCYVARTAIIGDNSRVQNHVSVWDGVEIGKNCFIGPKVCFTNHHNPQDRFKRDGEFIPDKTIIEDNVTICANSTLIAPLVIGEEVRIGAGSTVLRDIKSNEEVNWLVKN